MRTRAEQRAAGPERAEARFERLYAEHGRAVLAYAVRRASDAQDAADVVAETFLVAWRRLEEMPSAEATRPWLYGVARHVLANQQRSETGAVRAAVAQLGPEDQEILRLCCWEELTPGEIATVLGVSRVAARSRLHRARHRLRTALQELPEPEDPDLLRLQEAR